jgi:hypothetical protein
MELVTLDSLILFLEENLTFKSDILTTKFNFSEFGETVCERARYAAEMGGGAVQCPSTIGKDILQIG